jgi:glycosyltransferase involved in cell wall biosynthesis
MQNNISFFIPAYNCESTVEESINSILIGNFEHGDELIIVNDCSTDLTIEVLLKVQKKYPALVIINHNHNKGGGAARNTAIENAKNNLLFCLDADNVLKENSIAALKKYLLASSADVASFQHMHYFSTTKTETDTTWTLPSGVFTKEMVLSSSLTPGSGGNYLFTKQSWINAGSYPEFAGALDTWGFGVRQLLTGSKMVVLEGSFYYHRLSPNSYYLRDAWSRRKSISLRATQLLIPYFDLIEEQDIDYILSKKYRYTWFDLLDTKPLKIAKKVKADGIFEYSTVEKTNFIGYLKKIATHLFKKLNN